MKLLYVIPARGGSKGIPGKNIKSLCGKPLIYYSIDLARKLASDEDICVSSDNEEIIEIVKNYGLAVPFKRPWELATDEASTNDVLIHAIDHYESAGKFYDAIVLLQPTSPLRTVEEVRNAIELFDNNIEMVVSVKESHAAGLICEENEAGFIELIFAGNIDRRQDLKPYYEYNGAIYIINIESLKTKSMKEFRKIKKMVMSELHSIDIDTLLDWRFAEFIISDF